MSEQSKNMNPYSLADIERYLQGKLSPAEMHELEKAAVQDPFLADAIEGYQSTDLTTVKQDLADIHNRLSSEPAKIIPVIAKPNTWWRIAAAVILLAGVGIIGTKLFTGKNNVQELAKQETIAPSLKNSTPAVVEAAPKKDAAAAIQKNDLLAKNSESLHSMKKNTVAENFVLYDKKIGQPTAALSAKSYAYNESGIAKDTVPFDKIATKDLLVSNSSIGSAPGLSAQKNDENGMNRYLYKGTEPAIISNREKINNILVNGVTAGGRQMPLTASVNKGHKIKGDTVSFENGELSLLSQAGYLRRDEFANITSISNLSSLTVAGNILARKRSGITFATPVLTDQKQMNIIFGETKLVTPTVNAFKTKKDSLIVLPEVTVIGYGTTAKRDVTGSVSATNTAKESSRGAGGLGVSVIPTGGWYNFTKYLADKIASDTSIKREPAHHGSVEIKMNISAKGKVSKVSIVNSFDPQLNRILIKSISNGPRWVSGDYLEKNGFIFKIDL